MAGTAKDAPRGEDSAGRHARNRAGAVGRDREIARIREVLGRAEQGEAAALVLVGPPGIGKTHLLRAARTLASGWRVLTTSGVEGDRGAVFAGLARLVQGLGPEIEELTDFQAGALRAAVSQAKAQPGTGLEVPAALLAALSAAASERPTLLVVDDAQWLDAASLATLLFVVRRLDADRVAVLLARRDDPGVLDGDLDSVEVGPLSDHDAATLLTALAPDMPAAPVSLLVAEAAGNPLALVEFTALLDDGQRAGRTPVPRPIPGTPRIRFAYGDRLTGLSPHARDVVDALALLGRLDTGSLVLVGRALGVADPIAALREGVRARLLTEAADGADVTHPLVRSAALGDMTAERSAALHRAVAATMDETRDWELRAWHLAQAATDPDEDVAAALERAAASAAVRGDSALACDMLVRAARLSTRPDDRGRRLLGAARSAAFVAGPAEQLATAALADLDGEAAADAHVVRVAAAFYAGRSEDVLRIGGAHLAPLAAEHPWQAGTIAGFLWGTIWSVVIFAVLMIVGTRTFRKENA